MRAGARRLAGERGGALGGRAGLGRRVGWISSQWCTCDRLTECLEATSTGTYVQPFEAWYAVPRSSVARPSAQPTCRAASSACSLSTTPAHSRPSSCDAQGKWGRSCCAGRGSCGCQRETGLGHLQRARSSFAIAQQLAIVRGLLRLQVRFARIKELLKEPKAQRVLRLSLCQSLGDRVIWRLACSALLNGLAPPHEPHATDLHCRRGRPDVGRLNVEGCARRKRHHVSIRHATLWS